jgi:hypothetical protein
VVITDPGTRAAIAAPGAEILAKTGHQPFVTQAPVHIAICLCPEIYRARYRESDKSRAVCDWEDGKFWETRSGTSTPGRR